MNSSHGLQRCTLVPKAIREAASRGELNELTTPAADEDFAAHEGRLLMRRHAARERDPRLRRQKITEAIGRGQPLSCEVCGFDFGRTYEERGRGYIECHHVVPLHTLGPRVNRVQDLALVCANCHRMVHRAPWLTPNELRTTMLATQE
jgi:5-methylcytosine-specific restriction enzyme A